LQTFVTVLLGLNQKRSNPPSLPFWRHLRSIHGSNFRDSGVDKPFTAYQGDEPYIFVSYAHEDSDVVFSEIQWLRNQGFNLWYDEGISPGHEWHQELADRIDQCHLFLYFITPRSALSDHCQREVHYAIDNGKQLLAVHLEETALPSGINLSLSSIQAVMRHELSDMDYRVKFIKGVSGHIERGVGVATEPTPTIIGVSRKVTVAMCLVALLVGGLVVGMVVWHPEPTQVDAPRPLKKFEIDLASGRSFNTGQPIAISNDGQQIVFTDRGSDGQQLFRRDLNDLGVVPISGTEADKGRSGASSLALSPDSDWVVFNSPVDLAVKKVPVTGGTPITLTKVGIAGQRGLAWGPNDTVVITPRTYPGLTQVPAAGGDATPLTTPEDGQHHGSPWFLPGGYALLFTIYDSSNLDLKSDTARIAHLTIASGQIKVLFQGESPRFAASGHLLFTRDSSLWAAAFDPLRAEVVGEAIPVVENVGSPFATSTFYTVSDEGSLVYQTAATTVQTSELVLVDRNGIEEALSAAPRTYTLPSVSPDGQRIAVAVGESSPGSDIWLYSLDSGTIQRLTFDGGSNPHWTPDGSEIRFTRFPDGNIWSKAANGTGAARQLTSGRGPRWQVVRRHGVLYECDIGRTNCDIGVLAPGQETGVELIVQTDHVADFPSVSRDGRWLAYSSDESGQFEVYVRPYPNVDAGKSVVSTAGGG
jgi:hypothetical protein